MRVIGELTYHPGTNVPPLLNEEGSLSQTFPSFPRRGACEAGGVVPHFSIPSYLSRGVCVAGGVVTAKLPTYLRSGRRRALGVV